MVIKEEGVMVNIVLEDKVVRFREIVRVDARKDSSILKRFSSWIECYVN